MCADLDLDKGPACELFADGDSEIPPPSESGDICPIKFDLLPRLDFDNAPKVRKAAAVSRRRTLKNETCDIFVYGMTTKTGATKRRPDRGGEGENSDNKADSTFHGGAIPMELFAARKRNFVIQEVLAY